MLTKRKLQVSLKIKSVSETGEFSGYASVFGVKDSHSDIVIKGAFENSLKNWGEKGAFPALLWQHKMDEPIGVYTKMVEDDVGLYVEGRLLIEDDPLAKRAHAHMKAKSITGMSIGYDIEDDDYDYDSDKNAFILKNINLWEVSLVTFPSNDESRISNVKTALENGEIPRQCHVEKCLRDAGFSRKQAKAFMANGFKALRDADIETSNDLNNDLNN